MPTACSSARTRQLSVCAALALVIGSSGCSVAELVTSEKTQNYGTVADAPTEGNLAFQLPKGVVPEDATDITVRVKTDDPNLKAYDWASDSGQLPVDCEPSEPLTKVDPFYTGGGWPRTATQAAGDRCGQLFVTEVEGHSYAWLMP